MKLEGAFYISVELLCVTVQKTVIFIIIAMRTSGLTNANFFLDSEYLEVFTIWTKHKKHSKFHIDFG
jgi:hypothetical protein